MKSAHYTIFRLLAGLLTVAVIVAQHYIPPKIWPLRPNPAVMNALYFHARPNGTNSAYWVDQQKDHFHCDYAVGDPHSCGYTLNFDPDLSRGVDLSNYDGFWINLKYRGDASLIRLHLRNYNPTYDDPANPGISAKFMSVVIRSGDFNGPTYVRLSEFSVGEWWIQQFNAPRAHSAPEFTNVTGFGIDFISPHTSEIEVVSIELVGDWIQKETFYLIVIAVWMALILWEGFAKVYAIYQQSKTASQHIDRLLTDYQKLEIEKREFQALSTTDALTGVMNRAGLQQFLNKLYDTPVEQRQVALLVFDVDHFKRINDRRGHDAGDRVLQGVAKLIAENIRQSDIFGRWGGEEFILICPQIQAERLCALAEKIRSTVHEHIFESHGDPLKISVSIGAAVGRPQETFDELFKRADLALYEAKSGGRNCVVLSEAGGN